MQSTYCKRLTETTQSGINYCITQGSQDAAPAEPGKKKESTAFQCLAEADVGSNALHLLRYIYLSKFLDKLYLSE